MPAPLPSHHAPSPGTRPPRYGGLDGLRAIAVGLVLVYHLFPGALPGGFLGVDVFFVISGFLITSLMLRELAVHGRLRLFDFWRRRARRLLPALGITLLVCTSLAATVGGDLLVRIGQQIAGAALFVSNWVLIGGGTDYFARDTPELFRNTWSLAIEEQFYIVLPFLMLLLFRARRPKVRAFVLLALALCSAALMWSYSAAGVAPTRIYFGSDSHTFGLFLGAAMAALLHRDTEASVSRPSVGRQVAGILVTAAGLGVLAWCSITLAEGSAESFQGGFQLATVAALAVVWAITRNESWAGRALDVAPLRWIGERSYGIYLWHWPLLLIIGAVDLSWLDPMVRPWAIGVATLAATMLAAAASFRYVEQPVRQFGLITSLRLMVRPTTHGPRRRAVAIALGALLIVTVPTTVWAIAHAPRTSSAADAIHRGQEALDAQQADDGTSGPASSEGTPEDAPNGTNDANTDDTDTNNTDTRDDAAVATPPASPEGRDLDAIGDSVMLASTPELSSAFPGLVIDAAVSRGLTAGVSIATDLAGEGALHGVLVIGLGTNGPIDQADLEALHAVAAPRPLVLVNAHADREWIPEVNQTLADFAAAHRGVVVADWDGTVSGVDGALAGDDIHPNTSGGEIYAAAVQAALDELLAPGEAQGWAFPRR